jgi:hypothetical protein
MMGNSRVFKWKSSKLDDNYFKNFMSFIKRKNHHYIQTTISMVIPFFQINNSKNKFDPLLYFLHKINLHLLLQ